jgi:uncharacterized protein (TIGR03435 family)
MRTPRLSLLVVGAILAAGSLGAQTFDVASIKPNTSGESGARMNTNANGRVTVVNNTLFNIIRNAYNVQPMQIVRGPSAPDWLDRDRWDITAMGAPMTSPRQIETTLQALLTERFRLVVRRETREELAYALVVARADGRLGPGLTRSIGPCAELAALVASGAPLPNPRPDVRCGTNMGLGLASTRGVVMADFARNLGPMTGRPVIDRTGLTGAFDLELRWTPDQMPAGAPALPATDAPALFVAIQEQLGLKLEPTKAPLEVIVIESVQRPTPD